MVTACFFFTCLREQASPGLSPGALKYPGRQGQIVASFRRVTLVLAGQGMHWKDVTDGSLKKPTGQGTRTKKKKSQD